MGMKAKAKEKSVFELEAPAKAKVLKQIYTLKNEYMNLRMDKGFSKLQKTNLLRDKKKEIARNFTYLNQKGAYEHSLKKVSKRGKKK